MACLYPIWCVDLGYKDNGKKNVVFGFMDYTHSYQSVNSIAANHYPNYKGIFQVPCGHCLGCRLDYARHWANRCVLEASYHDYNYFITLTYDEDHVPKKHKYDFDNNKYLGFLHTLQKNDLQLFFKRLRKNTGQEFRYIACGEYGSKTYRPHYHFIAFGLKLDDLKLYKETIKGNYYNSDTIDNAWKLGFTTITEFSYDTASYVSRYTMKKAKIDNNDDFVKAGIEPEFIHMSRRPGIGAKYYDDNKDKIYKYDKILIHNNGEIFNVKPSRYFDKLLEKDDISLLNETKEIREYSRFDEIVKNSQSIADYFKTKENNLFAKVNILYSERSKV